jgi:hypothetical protein
MADIKSALNPKDASIINAVSGQNWIPKDPMSLVTPYIDKTKKELTSAEAKKQKAIRIYEDYGKMEQKCADMCQVIEEECKNVRIKLDPSSRLNVIEAVRRVFGLDGTEITFEMYKMAVKQMTDISNKSVPRPGAK